jgi:uncharacterized protein with ACT and thioredoxin-like domain
MNSYEAATAFCRNIGTSSTYIFNEVTNIISEEAVNIIDAQSFKLQKGHYESAVEIALNRIKDWYNTAQDFDVDVKDLEELRQFVGTHCLACVWAVLLGKQRKVYNKEIV